MKFGRFAPVYSPDDTTGGGGDTVGGGGDAVMPEGLPAQFWDEGTRAVKTADLVKSYGELSTFKSEYDARMAAVPEKPEDYKFEIEKPKDVEIPEGFEWKIDEKDPRIPFVREFAAKHKLTQDQLGELLALNMQFEVEAHRAADAALQAEMKKLGSNGPARVKAFEDFMKANVSKTEYEAIRPVLGNAEAFAAVEKLIAKITTQRVPGNGDGRDPPKDQPAKPVRTADMFYGGRS